MTASMTEQEGNIRIPVPVYDPAHQISVGINSEKGYYGDSELYAISVERTRVLREIQRISGVPASTTGGSGLRWALEHTDPLVGRRFNSHGIAKGDPVEGLNTILRGGIQPGRTLYTMPFLIAGGSSEAFGADYPKTEGGIILVSFPDKLITESGVKYVFVGEEYINAVGLLRKKYPQVQIIPWHDIPKTLTEDYNQTFGTNNGFTVLSDGNRPYYNPFKGIKGVIRVTKRIPEADTPSTSQNTDRKSEDIW